MTERKKTFAGAATSSDVPRYYLYGDESSADTWFVNVEPLSKRCRETNWYIAPHSHPGFMQIVLVRSGGGIVTADEHKIGFGPHCALIVPVHVVHGFKYDVDTDGWVLTISESYRRRIMAQTPEFDLIWQGFRHLNLADSPRSFSLMNNALLDLDNELEGGAAGAVVLAEAYLTSILVTLLRELGSARAQPSGKPRGHAAIVEQFKDLVERRYREGWLLQRFAEEMNVSYASLRAACLSVLGEPPIKVIQDRLVVEAKRNLIYSEMTVAQVAYWLGFEDPSYFSRFFQKNVGERPLAFRQSQRPS